MRNTNDVMQVRDPNAGLQHALVWITTSYEYYNSHKTVRFQNMVDANGKTFAFGRGMDWNDRANWDVNDCTGGNQSTPGIPNNKDNEVFISNLKTVLSNDFYINCSPINTPPFGATVQINLSAPGNTFQVYVDGAFVATTTTNPYVVPNLSPGNHVIQIIELETGCVAECIVEIICIEGTPCDDGDECTEGDVVNGNCECIGSPTDTVTFVNAGLDSLCNYCAFYISPEWCPYHGSSKWVINELVVQDETGTTYVLNSSTQGMRFPYCFVSQAGPPPGIPDCQGLASIHWDFIDDINTWISTNGYQGNAYYGEGGSYCMPVRSAVTEPDSCDLRLLIQSTDLHFVKYNYEHWYLQTSNNQVNYRNKYYWFEGPYDCMPSSDSIVAQVNCEGPYTYLWSNGATTAGIFVGDNDSNACYNVTVTCGNGCSYIGTYGEDCECIVGTPCPGDVPCTNYGVYDNQCLCPEPIPIPDFDQDGICDDVDPCVVGLACDDNNFCTINDVIIWDGTTCVCLGEPAEDIVLSTNGNLLTATINPDFCEQPIYYVWSNGATTPSIEIDPSISGACYAVTVTCGNGCIFTAQTGSNCDCVVGSVCPGDDPCLYYGFYDAACNCPTPLPLPDSDNDGVCDPIDQCPEEPDVDFDGDGIIDCLDPEIECENLTASIQVSEVSPGGCYYAINLDTALGDNNTILIQKLLINNGQSNIEIGGAGFPVCYGDMPITTFNVSNDNFESGWGFWAGLANDAKRVKENSNTPGEYSIRLRGNNEFSHMTSQLFSVNGMNNARIQFSYFPVDHGVGDKFIIQASLDGQNFQNLKELRYEIDYKNNIRFHEIYELALNNVNNLKFRIVSQSNGNSRYVFIDNVGITKTQNRCSQAEGSQQLVTAIQNWINSNGYMGSVSLNPPTIQDTCTTPGINLYISNTNLQFNGLSYNGDVNVGMQSFCTLDCSGVFGNNPIYNVSVTNVNCNGATYIWTNGGTSSSIQVPSLNATQYVTVTCDNGCSTVLTIGNGECIYGEACTPYNPCYDEGVFDAFCNCVGTVGFTDTDGDGICDEVDPCPNTADHSDSDSDGIPDCEECPPHNVELLMAPGGTISECSYCYDLTGREGQLLTEVRVRENGIPINLSQIPGFSFPYCMDLEASFCSTGEPFTSSYQERPSIVQFATDFYQWAYSNHPRVTASVKPDTSCAGFINPAIFIGDVRFSDITYAFSGGEGFAVQQNCVNVPGAFEIRIDQSTMPQCSPLSYLWSNGSTDSAIKVNNSNIGASVTITCGDSGCQYVATTPYTDCIIGAPCSFPDTCVTKAVYNEKCLCTPVYEPQYDKDRDGVTDRCDKCEGHDDNKDADGDGDPDGCDICEMDEVFDHCNYCVDLFGNNPNCYTMAGYSYILNGVNGYNSIGQTQFQVCPSTGKNINTTVLRLNQSFASWGFNAIAQSTGFSCSTKGQSITIRVNDPNLKFIRLNSPTTGTFLPFTEKCVYRFVPTPCDDGNPCTINDVLDVNCNCKGTCVDADLDGVCDGDGLGNAPCDRCVGSPDNIDINQNGIPDGCDESTFTCGSNKYSFCDYIELRAGCEYLEAVDMLIAQQELIVHFGSTGWNVADFPVPQLLTELQNPSGENDKDNDGLINFLDPCPGNANHIFTSANLAGCECNDNFYSDPTLNNLRNKMLANWMYTVTDYFKNGAPPPCTQGINVVEVVEIINGEEVKYIAYGANPGPLADNEGAEIKIEVECCTCDVKCRYDIDGDGICDENDPDIVICDDPPCAHCDPQPTCGQPDSPCHYFRIEDCKCVQYPRLVNGKTIGALPDSDGDGICDLMDVCDGEIDMDSDGDGIMNCLDLCDGEIVNHDEESEIPHPAGPGDQCDDGDPCTYGDHVTTINGVCTCQGYAVDLDFDGVGDCVECNVYFVSAPGATPVIVNKSGPFIPCDGCSYFVSNSSNPADRCDICPDLDDNLDYNNNGVPDCIDPKHYDIGCPEDFAIIPGQGLVLIFDADKIKVEDIPNPIRVFGTRSNNNSELFKNDYVTLANTREVNGTYEVLYPYQDLPSNLNTLMVSFSGGQPCPLINTDDPLADIVCPTVYSSQGNIFLTFDYAVGSTPDLFSFTGDMVINGNFALNNQNVPWNSVLTVGLSNIESYPSSLNGTAYVIFLNNALVPPLSNATFSGSVTLPNGIVCNYEPGTGVLSPCPAPNSTSYPGMPCDCDPTVMDCACYTHFRLDNNCNCIGDPKPDSDGDGICDEFDKCDLEENECELDPNGDPVVDADGDGYCDCQCDPLVLSTPVSPATNPSLVNSNDLSINFDIPDPSLYTGVTVTITGGPALDPIEMPLTSPLIIPNLPKGYSYTITVTAQCASGGTSSVSVEVEDVPFESNPMFCGIDLSPIDPSSYTLLPKLNQGDIITAANFQVHVLQAKGQYGKFSGKGYIEVPYLNNVHINVTFKDITVSVDRQMVAGFILVSGYGVAILGEPLSGDINEWTNEVINVLTDIDEILDVVGPILEAAEELVKSTEGLLSEQTKQCIENAVNAIKVLETEAKSTNPAPTPERMTEIIAEIKALNITLKQCNADAKNELAVVIDKMIDFIEFVIPKLSSTILPIGSPYGCNLANVTSNYVPNSLNYQNTFSQSINSIFTSLLGGNEPMAKVENLEKVDNTVVLPTNINVQQVKDFYEAEMEYEFCVVITKLNEILNANNGEMSLADATYLLRLFLALGTDVSSLIGNDLKNNVDFNDILTNNHIAIKFAFIKVINKTVYK